jgi:hypothetical protein
MDLAAVRPMLSIPEFLLVLQFLTWNPAAVGQALGLPGSLI